MARPSIAFQAAAVYLSLTVRPGPGDGGAKGGKIFGDAADEGIDQTGFGVTKPGIESIIEPAMDGGLKAFNQAPHLGSVPNKVAVLASC